jgi:hypothetical protein
MSRINEALKRAQQAQQENPPATPPLEFRPVDPDQQSDRHPALLYVGLACVTVAIFGLSGLLVYFVSQSKSHTLQVAARVVDPPLASLAAGVTNPPPEPAPSQPPGETTSVETTPGYIERPDEPNTNGMPVVAAIVEAIKPATAKLQGIFFNPQNPSAVINGRSVYLGDRVNGFRVMGISPVAVTLVSATGTNVLSLSGR